MHSRIFYIAENINNKEDFEEAFENAPDEDSIFESFSRYCDYVTEEDRSQLDRSLEWLEKEYIFFAINKDDIGFYFDITRNSLYNISSCLYQNLKDKIFTELSKIDPSNPSTINNSIALYNISDFAYPKFGLQILIYEDPPEPIEHFILEYGSVEEDESIRYYFIKSFDYHC